MWCCVAHLAHVDQPFPILSLLLSPQPLVSLTLCSTSMGSTVTNEECLKYAYCVTVLTQVLTDVLTHLIPKTALRCKYHYYFCISQKETENEGIKSLATETQVASG